MTDFQPRHLVIVRHGESEGDVRRALNKEFATSSLIKHPHDEEETERGRVQSAAAGKWIARFILDAYNISFDACYTSPLIRTRQSAESLGIGDDWQPDALLSERNRGSIHGLTPAEHASRYPESLQAMKKDPFQWVPPGGESMVTVAGRAKQFIENIQPYQNVLVMTHRDWIWAALIALENMSYKEVALVNTDTIRNAQVLHYTNVPPDAGNITTEQFDWKQSVCPWDTAMDIDNFPQLLK